MTDGVRTLATGGVNDALFSADGTTLYATQGGTITAFSVTTGAAVGSWTIGSALGGIDLSLDGHYLFAAETTGGPIDQHGQPGASGLWTQSNLFYQLDLTSGSVTSRAVTTRALSGGLSDVAVLADGDILVSQSTDFFSPFAIYHLTDGSVTTSPYSYSGSPGILTTSPDHTRVLLAATNTSGGNLYLFDQNAAQLAYTDTFHGAPGGNIGIQAISPDGSLIAARSSIFDSSLHLITDLAAYGGHFWQHAVSGVAFSTDGSKLYLHDSTDGAIYELSTSDFSTLRIIPVSEPFSLGTVATSPGYGNDLTVSPDGRYLSIIDLTTTVSSPLLLVDLQTAATVPGITSGTSGDDTLTADTGHTILNGLDGNDTLSDGGIAATLRGGLGSDTYHISNANAVIAEKSSDYGIDREFTSLATTTIAPNVEILAFEAGAHGTLIGSDGKDTLNGGSGDDTLNGGAGDDTLSGGAGADIINGEGGNDTLSGGDDSDVITGGAGDDIIDGGNGNDIAIIGVERAAATIALDGAGLKVTSSEGIDRLVNVETIRFTDQDVAVSDYVIVGTPADETLTGTSGPNALFGGGGNDTLQGLGGDDVLYGGSGNDVFDGGDGSDTAFINDSRLSVRIIVTPGGDVSVFGFQTGVDTLKSIEFVQFYDAIVPYSDLVLTGTSGNDDLTATAAFQYVGGGAGNDILRSGALNGTTLDGGDGDDLLIGIAFANRFVGGSGIDTVDYSGATSGVTVNFQSGFGSGSASYSQVENVIGSAFDDTLTGDANANVLTGGGGNDSLAGGDGNDVAIINATRAASTITIADTGEIQVSSSDGMDRLSGIETIRFTDQDFSTASLGIIGTPAGESLAGTAGDDTIYGLGGGDILSGGDGNDRLIGGAGNDTLIGGPGNDVAVFSGASTSVGITVTANGDIRLIGPDGIDTLRGIEQLEFSDRTVAVSDLTLVGTGGADDLTATANGTYVAGLAGDDMLRAGGFTQVTLDGGLGNDVYYVSDASTVVTERPDEGNDTVITSIAYAVPDNVETLVLAPGADAVLTASAAGTNLVGNALDNVLYGSAGADTLTGGAGSDTLLGGAGADIFRDTASGLDGDLILDLSPEDKITITDATLATFSFALHGQTLTYTGGSVRLGSLPDGQLYAVAGSAGGVDIAFQGAGGTAFVDDIMADSLVTVPAPVKQSDGSIVYPTSPILVDSADGHVSLVDVGQIQFTDGTIYTANLSAIDSVFAPIFGRHPTTAEYAAFSSDLQTPLSPADVQSIYAAPEFDSSLSTAISHLYQYYGGRDATTGELTAWKGAIQGGVSLAQMRTMVLDNPLGQNHSADVITRTYLTYAGRAPGGNEISAWQAVIRAGTDFDQMRQAILNDPLGQSHTQTSVTAIYQSLAGRAPSSGEIAAANGQLLGGADFNAVRSAVLADTTIHAYEIEQITSAYQTYGGRAPADGEITAWHNLFVAGGGNYRTIRDAILNTSLGTAYTDAQIDATYRTYAGRAAGANEINAWENFLNTNNHDFNTVRAAILDDPMGKAHSAEVITQTYLTYAGRAPGGNEISAWQAVIRAGTDFDQMRQAILNNPLGLVHTQTTVAAIYQSLAGRTPTADEMAAANNQLLAGGDFSAVRSAVLADTTIHAYEVQQITSAYQTYGGRAPTGGEITAWHNLFVAGGGNYGTVRDAILNTSLGTAYTDAQINAAYQTYAGRAAGANEINAWENFLNTNNHDYNAVRAAILGDPVASGYANSQIDALYQRYFQHAASAGEQAAWRGVFSAGADFDALRDALMSSSGSAAIVQQLAGTPGADSFHFAAKPYLAITGFNPAQDVIDLQGLGFTGIDPLDTAHARDVHQLDGTNDVFIALDATHEILLHNISLAQLSSADFLL